jgi:uncharacterized membrane protein
VYDLMCRSPAVRSDLGLMLVLYAILVAIAWGYTQVFTGRAAFLHLGALTATIMSANVAMIIIPNQRKVVAALRAGETPEARLGAQAKQRSLHNTYLTLPVIFLMLSNHYPLAFATHYNWLIAALVFLMGVTIRHYFNSYHGARKVLIWTWVVTLLLFGAIVWLSILSPPTVAAKKAQAARGIQQAFMKHKRFDQVVEVVMGRCSMCHAKEPVWEGVRRPPKGVVLETGEQIAAHARDIYLQAGISRAMPPGNVTFVEPVDRAVIAEWYKGTLAGGAVN